MSHKKILLVDDSGTTRVFQRSLITHKTDFVVETAADGQEALKKAFQQPFDLIIMDVMMPKMNGLEACRLLKKDARTKDIPIILVTFRTGEESVQEGFDSGCDEYLLKPVDPIELLRLLEKYLGTTQPLRSYALGNL